MYQPNNLLKYVRKSQTLNTFHLVDMTKIMGSIYKQLMYHSYNFTGGYPPTRLLKRSFTSSVVQSQR